MISTEDFKRLSAELTAQKIDFVTWGHNHGISEETMDELAASFMMILEKKIENLVDEIRQEREENDEEMPRVGMIDPSPAMLAMFVQAFIYGWESAEQYGKQNDPSHVTG